MTFFRVSDVFQHLNGIINIYKPKGMKWKQIKSAILHNISRDLKSLKFRCIEHNNGLLLKSNRSLNNLLSEVENSHNYYDLLTREDDSYEIGDISCSPVINLGVHTSGILLLGLNTDDTGMRKYRQENRYLHTYQVTGRLGIATEDNFFDSCITYTSKYNHIFGERISALVGSIQASYQRKIYEQCGVDLQSQIAYKITSESLPQSINKLKPAIYGLKLIVFDKPFFVLEIQLFNASEQYLAALIHDIGIQLRTAAHCSAIRCIRIGRYTIEKSLLRHDWNLSGVIKNIRENEQ